MSTEITSIRPQDKVHTPTPAIKPEVNYKTQAYGKACPNTSAHVILFSIGCFFSFYFQFLCLMPATEGILRSVDSTYKSFALAIQWLSTRTLAMLPGPTILALFIDSSCLYWRPGETYCILYDNYYFSRNLATYGFYFRHLSIYILFYMMFNEKVIL
uniref:Solute carrier organic anion transporter family member 4A1 n=1 Tax=Cacopsylla melanoneura TaxID=428564 RepID=A0A8D8LAG4_9HEMI